MNLLHTTVVTDGHVAMGKGNTVMAFTCLAGLPHIRGVSEYDKPLIIGDGNQIGEHCTLKRGAKIGDRNIIMGYVNIGHDVEIGSDCEIGCGVKILGHAKIGSGVMIKAGAMIRNRIKICSGVIVGMRANVTKDITEVGVYFGNPARKRD